MKVNIPDNCGKCNFLTSTTATEYPLRCMLYKKAFSLSSEEYCPSWCTVKELVEIDHYKRKYDIKCEQVLRLSKKIKQETISRVIEILLEENNQLSYCYVIDDIIKEIKKDFNYEKD